jgi:hypothetical protein
MPIVFNQEKKEWEIADLTPEEVNSILQIGKEAIVNGLGRDMIQSKYKAMLVNLDEEKFFNA